MPTHLTGLDCHQIEEEDKRSQRRWEQDELDRQQREKEEAGRREREANARWEREVNEKASLAQTAKEMLDGLLREMERQQNEGTQPEPQPQQPHPQQPQQPQPQQPQQHLSNLTEVVRVLLDHLESLEPTWCSVGPGYWEHCKNPLHFKREIDLGLFTVNAVMYVSRSGSYRFFLHVPDDRLEPNRNCVDPQRAAQAVYHSLHEYLATLHERNPELLRRRLERAA